MLEIKEVVLIKEIIKKRNIKWLCHFTPRENLEFIKKDGLQPRNLITHQYQVTDTGRFDRFKNSICLSISKPNKWIFDKKKESGLDLCLLLISPDILFEKECLFYPHNAATASYRNIDINELKGYQALENLFLPSISYQKSNLPIQTSYRNDYLLDCETTSDQAEVQCLDIIEPKYIEYILDENPIPLEYNDIISCIENRKEKMSEFLGVIQPISLSKIPSSKGNFSEEDNRCKNYSQNPMIFKNNSGLSKAISEKLKFNEAFIKAQNEKLQKNEKYNSNLLNVENSKKETKYNDLYKRIENSSSNNNEFCICIIIIFIILSLIL